LAQVVLDEVQKLPKLLEVVHALIEEKTGQQFVLTGSSARKLRTAGVNLLGGRAVHVTLHPYMASELGSHFEIKKALNQGMLPVVWGAKDPRATIQAYNGQTAYHRLKTLQD
jgi:predicted AAA+ superfamily ATPase